MGIYLGGEHIIPPSVFVKKSKAWMEQVEATLSQNYSLQYSFGGHYSLLAIYDHIIRDSGRKGSILLPSYICPSVIRTLQMRQAEICFYPVDANLQIDPAVLLSYVQPDTLAVLIVDYFGRCQKEVLSTAIAQIQEQQIPLIQDVVQCLEIKNENLYGDFVFNSYRKFFPFEGSLLLSKKPFNITFKGDNSRYLQYKRKGQRLRYLHLKTTYPAPEKFISALESAEALYARPEVIPMPTQHRRHLNAFNLEEMIQDRRHYFRLLLSRFSDYVPRYLQQEDYTPLGFVMKLPQRDAIQQALRKDRIFAPVHWNHIPLPDVEPYRDTIRLSRQILTLPLSNMKEKEYDYVSEKLNQYLKHEHIS